MTNRVVHIEALMDRFRAPQTASASGPALKPTCTRKCVFQKRIGPHRQPIDRFANAGLFSAAGPAGRAGAGTRAQTAAAERAAAQRAATRAGAAAAEGAAGGAACAAAH